MDLFQKNLQALKKIQPKIADRLEHPCGESHHIRVLQAKDGSWTLQVQGRHGQWVLLHSLESPEQTARARIKDYTFEDYSVTVLFGFGMGYLAEAIVERMEDHHTLIIYEADPAILRTAFRYRDFSELFRRRNVLLQVGEEADTREWQITLAQNIMANRLAFVEYQPALTLHPEYYPRIREEIEKFYEVIRMDVRTLTYIGKTFVRNFLENIPVLATSRGVRCLKGIAEGIPVIIISAGPSLERNFHHLKQAKGRSILIAVDTIVRFLMANEIVPDFVVALDYKAKNIRKFNNLDLRGSRLVFTATACPEILHRFGGEVFGISTATLGTSRRFIPFLGEIGQLSPGQSVGNFAFELAVYMRGNPIAFIGQDMAFEPESLRKYTEGVPSDWTHEGKRLLDDTDIFGNPVKTFLNYKNIQTVMEYRIKRAKEDGFQIFNATEGGLGFRGVENVRLEDFIAKYCQVPVDLESRILEDTQRGMDLEGLIEDMEQAIRNIRKLYETARKVLTNIRKVERTRQEDRKVRLSQVLEHLTQEVSSKQSELRLFQDVAYDLNLSMYAKEMMEIDRLEDEDERLQRQISRGKIYYQRMVQELPYLLKVLRQNLERIRALRSAQQKSTAAKSPADLLKVGERFLEIGLYREARKIFEPLWSKRPAPEIAFGLGRALLGTFALEEAEQLLQEAARRDPDNRLALEFYQESQKRLSEWKEERTRIQKPVSDPETGREKVVRSLEFYLAVKNPSWAEYILLDAGGMLQNEDWRLLLRVCHLHEEKGDVEGCLRIYEHALKKFPERPEFYLELGRLTLRLGEVQRAIAFLLEAVEQGLQSPEDLEGIGDLLLEAGAYPQAVLFYEAALEQAPQQFSCAAKAAQAYQRMIQTTLH